EGLGRVLLLALLEAENERHVPVLLDRALPDDDDRSGLNHRDPRHRTVLFEELRRADLAAEDPRLKIHCFSALRVRSQARRGGGNEDEFVAECPLVRAVVERWTSGGPRPTAPSGGSRTLAAGGGPSRGVKGEAAATALTGLGARAYKPLPDFR